MKKGIHDGKTGEVVLIDFTPEEEAAAAQIAAENAAFEPVRRMEEIVVAVQTLLDSTARDRGYDNIFTLCTYEADPDPIFAAEGAAGKVWRSTCWATAREIKEAVIAQTRPLPTVAEVLSEMPAMVWPA